MRTESPGATPEDTAIPAWGGGSGEWDGSEGWGGDSTARLTVELVVEADHCRLVVEGELSGATIAALEAQLDQLACTPCADVRLDLRALRRADETGLRVLDGLCHYVRGRGGVVTTIGGERYVDRWHSFRQHPAGSRRAEVAALELGGAKGWRRPGGRDAHPAATVTPLRS